MPRIPDRHSLRSITTVLLLAACLMPDSSSAQLAPAPDHGIAIVNARIWTGDPRRPWADALLATGDRLAIVGSSAEVRKAAGSGTRVIDAKGGFVVPGFIDAHVHFVDGGFRLSSVLLRDAATPEEFTARIRAFAATVPPGTWITGGDWDHEQWGGALPERSWIDSVTSDHPVWINRLDGHMALANSAALRLAGLDARTPDVEGGTIVRDAAGAPTGVLKDNAMGLVGRVVPDPTPELTDRAIDAASRYVAEQDSEYASDPSVARLPAGSAVAAPITAPMPSMVSWKAPSDR